MNQNFQIGEAKITLAAQKGEKIDNRSRIEAVKAQEEMIKSEKDQQARKDLIDSEKDRIKEEVSHNHSSSPKNIFDNHIFLQKLAAY